MYKLFGKKSFIKQIYLVKVKMSQEKITMGNMTFTKQDFIEFKGFILTPRDVGAVGFSCVHINIVFEYRIILLHTIYIGESDTMESITLNAQMYVHQYNKEISQFIHAAL